VVDEGDAVAEVVSRLDQAAEAVVAHRLGLVELVGAGLFEAVIGGGLGAVVGLGRQRRTAENVVDGGRPQRRVAA
ncbi:MAG: hypothetical protein GY788_02390, partial [bacterium]|nr:hypothetical protein [bacterium]